MSDPKPKGPASWRGDQPASAASKDGDRGSRIFGLLLGIGVLAATIVGIISIIGSTPKPAFIPIVVQDYVSLFPDFHPTYRDHESFRKNLGHLLNIDADDKPVERVQNFADRVQKIASTKSKEPVIVYVSSLAVCLRIDGQVSVQLIPGDTRIDDLSNHERLFPLKKLLEAFQTCAVENDRKLLVLDIMQPLADPRLGVLVDDVAAQVREEIGSIKDLRGVILCACSAGETSHVSEDLMRTPFGHYFEEGLRGYADRFGESGKGTGKVTVKGLANFVRERVSRWASENRLRSQIPEIRYGTDEDFLLLDTERRRSGHSIALSSLLVDNPPDPAEPSGEAPESKAAKDGAEAKKDSAAKPGNDGKSGDAKPAGSKDDAKSAKPPAFENMMPSWVASYWQLADRLKSAGSSIPAPGIEGQLLRQSQGLAVLAEKRWRGGSPTAETKPQTDRIALEDGIQGSTMLRSQRTAPSGLPSLSFSAAVSAPLESKTVDNLRGKLASAFEKARTESKGAPDFAARRGKLAKVVEESLKDFESEDAAAFAAAVIAEAAKPRRPAEPALWQFAAELLDAKASNIKTRETAWLRRIVAWQENPAGSAWPTELQSRLINAVVEVDRLAAQPAAFAWIESEASELGLRMHRVEAIALSPGYASVQSLDRELSELESTLGTASDALKDVVAAFGTRDQALRELPAYVGFLQSVASGQAGGEWDRLVDAWSSAIDAASGLCDVLDRGPSADGRRSLRSLSGNVRQNISDLENEFRKGLDDLFRASLGSARTRNDRSYHYRLEAMLATPLGSLEERGKWYAAMRRFSSRLNKGTIESDYRDDELESAERISVTSANLIRPQIVAAKRAELVDRLFKLGGFAADGLIGSNDPQALGGLVHASILEVRKLLETPAKDESNRQRMDRLAWIRFPEFTEDDKRLAAALAQSGMESAATRRGESQVYRWMAARADQSLADSGAFDGEGVERFGTEALARLFAARWNDPATRSRFGASNPITPAANPPTIEIAGETPALDRPGAAWRNARLTVKSASPQDVKQVPRVELIQPDGNRYAAKLGTGQTSADGSWSAALMVELSDPRLAPAAGQTPDPKGLLVRVERGGAAYHRRVPVALELKPEIVLTTNRDQPESGMLARIEVTPFGASAPEAYHVMIRNHSRELQSFDVAVLDGEKEIFRAPSPVSSNPGQLTAVRMGPKKPFESFAGPLNIRITDKSGNRYNRSFPVGVSQQMRLKSSDVQVAFQRSKGSDGVERGDSFDLELSAEYRGNQPLSPPCDIAMEFAELQRFTGSELRKTFLSGSLSSGRLLLFARELTPHPGGTCELFVRLDGYPRRLAYSIQTTVGNRPICQQFVEPMLRLKLAPPANAVTAMHEGTLMIAADRSSPVAVGAVIQAANEPAGSRVSMRLMDDDRRPIESRMDLPTREPDFQYGFDDTGRLLISGEVKDPVATFMISGRGGFRIESAFADPSLGEKLDSRRLVIDSTPPDVRQISLGRAEIRAGEFSSVSVEGEDPESGIARVLFFTGAKPADDKSDPANATEGEPEPSRPGIYTAKRFSFASDGDVTLWAMFENRLKMRSFVEKRIRVAPRMSAEEKKEMEKKAARPGSIAGRIVSETGGAVSNARVTLFKKSKEPGETVESLKEAMRPVVSRSGGAFSFADVPPGEYVIQAVSRDDVLFGQEKVTVVSGQEAKIGEITIGRRK